MKTIPHSPASSTKSNKNIHEVGLGETIDGFTVSEFLAESEAATLYRVTHPDHQMVIVMKVPKLNKNLQPSTYAGFESESRILSGLYGRYAPVFVASGDMAENPYLVMEFIEGNTLSDAIKNAPLSADRIAKLMIPVCKAIHELHRQNVIHLDLRPANIRNRSDGTAVIIDYGSAHHAHLPDMYEDAHEDAPLSVAYISPEQIHHIRTDSRSDIYAIGVMLYQMATAKLPFGQNNLFSVKRRLRSAPLPPRAIVEQVPPWLQEIIYMCMEVYPDKRYATAQKISYLLSHPHMVPLRKRSHDKNPANLVKIIRRWIHAFGANIPQHSRLPPEERLSTAPHVLVALDLDNSSLALKDALRAAVQQVSQMQHQTFFTCLTILARRDETDSEDPESLQSSENPQHVQAQVALRHWIKPLKLSESQVNFQVYYGDPADAIIEYAKHHLVDQVVMGARGTGTMHRLLGSVSQKVLAYAPCTVTVVKTHLDAYTGEDSS